MNVTMIPLSELHPSPKNIRIHSAKQIEEYKRSVEKFGQLKPIVCDEENTILIGHGLYEAMVGLGMTEAACLVRSGLTERNKMKMMMADNKIYSLGMDDLDMIESIIAELGADDDFDIPGWDEDLLETLTMDLNSADDFMSGYGLLDEDSKAGMQDASTRYQKQETSFAASAQEIKPSASQQLQDGAPLQSGQAAILGDGNAVNGHGAQGNELQRRYIVCPKCGETIWL